MTTGRVHAMDRHDRCDRRTSCVHAGANTPSARKRCALRAGTCIARTARMKALRLVQWGAPAVFQDAPMPEAGPGQVIVKIAGAGACHTDLHFMEWPPGLLPWKLPFTLGHENAGWVHEVGDGVTSVRRGDAVLVYGSWGCGVCRPCRLGRENTCQRAAEVGSGGGGLGVDGGMAEDMLVPSARYLVALGDLDPMRAAPLADAALTPYHAIATSRDRLVPGATAAVIGVGGLGQMAIQ